MQTSVQTTAGDVLLSEQRTRSRGVPKLLRRGSRRCRSVRLRYSLAPSHSLLRALALSFAVPACPSPLPAPSSPSPPRVSLSRSLAAMARRSRSSPASPGGLPLWEACLLGSGRPLNGGDRGQTVREAHAALPKIERHGEHASDNEEHYT